MTRFSDSPRQHVILNGMEAQGFRSSIRGTVLCKHLRSRLPSPSQSPARTRVLPCVLGSPALPGNLGQGMGRETGGGWGLLKGGSWSSCPSPCPLLESDHPTPGSPSAFLSLFPLETNPEADPLGSDPSFSEMDFF